MDVKKQILVKVAKELASRGYVEVVNRGANGQIIEILKVGAGIAQQAGGIAGIPAQLPMMAVNALGQVASTVILKKKLNGMDLKLDGIATDIKNMASNLVVLQGTVKAVAGMGVISIGLQAANLVTTAAGFAMMNSKLNKIIDSIGGMQESLNKIIRKQDEDIKKEFNSIKDDYADMLDADKRQQPYTEQQYYELTRKMHSMIDYLYACYMSDAVEDEGAILQALYVLLPMYANVLRRYDKEYYFQYKDKIRGGSVWHGLHNEWMDSFSRMTDKKYLDKFQDYCFLEDGMSARDADEAVLNAYLVAVNSQTIVDDNQKILLCFEDKDEYRQFQDELLEEAHERVTNAVNELDEETVKLLNPAFAQAAQEIAATL